MNRAAYSQEVVTQVERDQSWDRLLAERHLYFCVKRQTEAGGRAVFAFLLAVVVGIISVFHEGWAIGVAICWFDINCGIAWDAADRRDKAQAKLDRLKGI